MTKAELHNTPGFHPASLLAATVHLRVEMKRQRGGDATALINNEGWMNGFLDAIEALGRAATPEALKGEKKTYQPYSAPQQTPPENHNQK